MGVKRLFVNLGSKDTLQLIKESGYEYDDSKDSFIDYHLNVCPGRCYNEIIVLQTSIDFFDLPFLNKKLLGEEWYIGILTRLMPPEARHL